MGSYCIKVKDVSVLWMNLTQVDTVAFAPHRQQQQIQVADDQKKRFALHSTL